LAATAFVGVIIREEINVASGLKSARTTAREKADVGSFLAAIPVIPDPENPSRIQVEPSA